MEPIIPSKIGKTRTYPNINIKFKPKTKEIRNRNNLKNNHKKEIQHQYNLLGLVVTSTAL